MHADFDAELWLYEGEAAWHFVTVPAEISDEIDAAVPAKRGFGSVPVQVTVGSTTWTTSVFPDSKRQAYLLPMKKDVRRREELDAGAIVRVSLEVVADHS